MKAGGKNRLSPNQAWLLKLPSTPKKKKTSSGRHIRNIFLTCTKNHKSCETTNQRTTIFQECKNLEINPSNSKSLALLNCQDIGGQGNKLATIQVNKLRCIPMNS